MTHDTAKREWLIKTTGYKTVPQIFIDGQAIGGYEQLVKLNQAGKLDRL